jgi:hypothetical protein
MTSRKFATCAAGLAAAWAIGLAVKVHAGADKVAFPENYANGVMWLSVDKDGPKQVHELYAPREAIQAAHVDQAMPSGTVFIVVRYSAKVDDKGQPIKDANGRMSKDKILGFNVMEKRTGWGAEYPETIRNGEWEYRSFNADKSSNDTVKLTVCFECHKPLVKEDYVHAYNKLKAAAM